MAKLLGGSVYHYHTKLMMKDARTGGAHLWHQDFGYWVNNGCVFPDMGTCFIPIDKMDAENAGLKVIRGSHRMGLIQHKTTGAQAEVDQTRLGYAQQLLETVQLEMDPGDACFFHCLTLHASGQNHSDRRRWCFLVAFNRESNDPMIEHHHPRATPLLPARDDAILDPATPLIDPHGKDFMDPKDDRSVKIDMTLTAPGCPVAGEMPGWVQNAVSTVEGVSDVEVTMVFDPPWTPDRMSEEAQFAVGWY